MESNNQKKKYNLRSSTNINNIKDKIDLPYINDRVICIGDLHGNINEVKILWGHIIKYLNEKVLCSATVVFLGDYCDRGPHTKEVFDWLIELKESR